MENAHKDYEKNVLSINASSTLKDERPKIHMEKAEQKWVGNSIFER